MGISTFRIASERLPRADTTAVPSRWASAWLVRNVCTGNNSTSPLERPEVSDELTTRTKYPGLKPRPVGWLP